MPSRLRPWRSIYQSTGLSEVPAGHGDGADVEGRVANDPEAFRVLEDERGPFSLDVSVEEQLGKLDDATVNGHLSLKKVVNLVINRYNLRYHWPML